ncbi:MAG: hypothetical protein U9R29_04545 [Thermodesulfobacteriota bacterium]|nr:hypothetical protein [Thermodesulfobacteriota bacterium]
MPFKHILAGLLDANLGVCSAIIADWDGEAVDWLSSGLCDDDDDLKIFGAHLGILLNQLYQIASATRSGMVEEVAIRVAGADWFVFPITSEYYLAVAAPHTGHAAQICTIARRCVKALHFEIS